MGLEVEVVDDIPQGFIGLNDLAAKAHCIKMLSMTLWVKKGLSYLTHIRTLRHEILERGKMALGWSYEKAHRFANYHENDTNILEED